ncbi:MAG: WecB/TagA/CpsF family glycosyltransferase [Fibrobacteraceae bacterium]|nr:WecB/TagA/CpsF family glycosyltransferase [Fibrobacteraceae bacterium]
MPISPLIKKIISTNSCYTEIFEDRGKIYTFLNPVSYLDALKNKELFEKFDGIFVDGKFLSLFIKWFYRKHVKRCSFDMTSLAPELFHYAENYGKSIYIVASKPDEVEKSISIFGEHYPKLNFVGFRNGYFTDDMSIDVEVSKIVVLNPSYVVCGMGIINQEKFLKRLKEAGYNGIAFTCGGFISQTAQNKIPYYPKFFDALNLRFVYRIIKEKHTRKRYLQAIFCFPVKFFLEKMQNAG